jgi:hypothetical protein
VGWRRSCRRDPPRRSLRRLDLRRLELRGRVGRRRHQGEGSGLKSLAIQIRHAVERLVERRVVNRQVPLFVVLFHSPRRSASRAMTASLARPVSGGAFTFTLSESPSQPTISSRDDPGTTFRIRRPMR